VRRPVAHRNASGSAMLEAGWDDWNGTAWLDDRPHEVERRDFHDAQLRCRLMGAAA
jgi:hypothetical protein